jgi:ketosteroid isomerase-like protein
MELCWNHAGGRLAAIAMLFTLMGGHAASANDLQQTIAQYHLAENQFQKGNPQPYKDLCSHADDVTIFGGFGGFEKGWAQQVEKRYDWASARFSSDNDQHQQIETISLVETAQMAYSVEIERSQARVGNSGEVRPLALRVTTIFRLESGEWKLVHRHADPLVEGVSAMPKQ